MTIKILCPEPESFSRNGLDYARSFSYLLDKKLNQEEFEKIAPKFDAVLVRFNTRIDASILNPQSSIKAVISPTTGLDHINLELAKKNGVKVFHLRGQKEFLRGISATAELTIGLMLSILRKIPQSFSDVKNGVWESGPYTGNEVYGKTIGIIGCGRLGSKVAIVAASLGMKVISYDPFITHFPKGVTRKNNISDLFNQSDIISLHIPLSKETKYFISDKEINQMKDGVVIINTSRGLIIDTSSLLLGLKTGKVLSAALDVIEGEHLKQGIQHPLVNYARNNNNLLITPHIGGTTFESVEKTDLFILKRYYKDIISNE
jgi:D-3-phosphoglycerate dehydrogenase / 2-oxoglutarate reductase